MDLFRKPPQALADLRRGHFPAELASILIEAVERGYDDGMAIGDGLTVNYASMRLQADPRWPQEWRELLGTTELASVLAFAEADLARRLRHA